MWLSPLIDRVRLLLFVVAAMPSRRPARPAEMTAATARFFARLQNLVVPVARQRIVRAADGVRGQSVRRHQRAMFKCDQAGTGYAAGNVIVIVRVGWMVDAVASTARGAPLQRQELLTHPAMVDQRNGAAVQQRKEVGSTAYAECRRKRTGDRQLFEPPRTPQAGSVQK